MAPQKAKFADGIPTKFTEGERVLCFHGPLLYEAKCVKSNVKEKTIKYFIHYNGWNKNWDEWVPESRVLKFNDGNIQRQKDLLAAHLNKTRIAKAKAAKQKPADREKDREKDKEKAQEEKASKKASQTETSTSSVDAPRKKRARLDPTVESEETFINKIDIKVKIPDELKPILVDDWDLVTRQKQLVHLPAKTTVDQLLDDYIKHKKLKKDLSPAKESAIVEITQGIKEYFNTMLGTQLLYKFERPQYADVLSKHPDEPMTKVYGAHHLLRLFVKIGNMLAYTTLDEKSVSLLLTHVHDLLKYLYKNSTTFFQESDYEVAPPDYHRKAL
ncbi:mortality factor 4-like protein 1 [Antedon mediterranea]|uniref:mortality factor 4-like protein 1 n=1 Tax=Antedon mediterranea TaxID=105859 RepID=UPI003AF61D0C